MVGKKIVLAVTGSIAAYKAATLTRLLVKAGAQVQVLMTAAAADFISPLTLATLSKRAVFQDVSSEQGWNNHVEIGLWADAMLVAPATANSLARLSNGVCDNIVAAVYLSARCPVFFAPAMDVDMWHHPATQLNISQLQKFGNHVLPVGVGELASGLHGEGRMEEPENIVAALQVFFEKQEEFRGKKILLTAGPTHEPLDPVRFIGNHSTGKMGIAIAENFAKKGAQVTLILGPTTFLPTHHAIKTIRVQTAQQMCDAATAHFAEADVAILSAAVADYRPVNVSSIKIKKQSDSFNVELERTPDIAATLGAKKKANQILVGFALETNDELAHAKAKLERKNFDFIVLNSLQDAGAGFGYDTNKISIVRRNGDVEKFELKTKIDVAEDIATAIKKILAQM